MGEFATVVLGLGLISLGAALVLNALMGIQLPPGITEIAVTVLAIVGRALLTGTKSNARGQDEPTEISGDAPDPFPDGATGQGQEPADLRNSETSRSHMTDS
tara:strand:- start:383 stop:688 length:306 start_codon:yes stop_codon:yes gene_type:complete